MTVTDLLRRTRKKLDDVVGSASEKFWSDQQLLDDYANKAQEDMCRKVRRLIIQTAAINIVAGTATYDMATFILEIIRLKPTSSDVLQRCDIQELDSECPGWEDWAQATPWGYIVDLNTQAFTLVPNPVASDTGTMTVGRLPQNVLSYLLPSESPEIPTRYHSDLIPGICAQALEDGDQETVNAQLAAKFRKEFDDRCEAILREVIRQTTTGAEVNRLPYGLY